MGTIHGGPCSGSARPKTLLSGSSRPSLVSRPRRLLLASLTRSERRGKLHPERPASCRRSVVSGDRRLLHASLTGSERRGKLHPERPASCRRSVVSGDRRLLLASLTGSERKGKATSRAPGFVPSLRRLRRPSSPARIPNWEREEGQATSRAPGLVPSLRPNDAHSATCSGWRR